jgi:hypothetical protein
MILEISELLLPAIVIQILQSIKELVCHTFDNKNIVSPKLVLEIQDLLLLATVLLPRLDDNNLKLLLEATEESIRHMYGFGYDEYCAYISQ